MMKKNLSILKPDIRTLILDNDISEKVTYLSVPKKANLNTLKADMKLGAEQFSELVHLVEKEHEPRYIVLTAENLEQGYMAVSYLQAAFLWKHRNDVFEEREDCEAYNEGCEDWTENPFQIPIIKEGELKQSISNSNNPFAMGEFFIQGEQKGMIRKPYWVHCKKHPVCVVCQESSFMDFGRMDDENLYEGLNLFSNNEKVYILNLKAESVWEDEDYEEPGFYGDSDRSRSKWNYIVLSFAADEADVLFEKKGEKKYYKAVISGTISKQGYQTQKGFSLERIANLVIAMKEKNKCKLVENLVNYAVKDKNEGEKTLSNQDFAFMERFVRCEKINEGEKKGSARKTLQENLIGLESVKEQVFNVVNVMKYNRMRAEMNIGRGGYHNVHIMLGAPGTAKTTVAKLMGQIMLEEKLLPDNRFTCVNGAELKGMYVGHSAPKTKALFEENDIIVIDEAYSLVGDGGQSDSFSKEAIAQLIIELENHAMDKLVIFAGYGGSKVTEKNNKMKDFLDANPGIKSRITSTIYFDSYSSDEMTDIFFCIAKNQNYEVEERARELIKTHFRSRISDENFGNGREARSLLETSVIFAAKRVFSEEKKTYTKADMQKITFEDVQQAVKQVQEAERVQNPCTLKKTVGFSV